MTALEELFRPRSVSEQLEYGLSQIGRNMDDYRKATMLVVNELVRRGFVIRPALVSKGYGARCAELVELVRGLSEEQVLMVPYDAHIFPTGNRGKLSKKGKLVKAARYYPKMEGSSSEERVKAAQRTVSLDDILVGNDFQGVREDRRYRVFMDVDALMAALAYQQLEEGDFEATVYDGTDKVLSQGCKARVTVPSFSGKGSYTLDLVSIPVYRGERPTQEAIKTSFCVGNDGRCPREDFFRITYGRPEGAEHDRSGGEVLFDHHAILGFKIAKHLLEAHCYHVIDPFPEPDCETTEFFWKLNNQVLIEKIENGRIRREPLGETKVLTEIMLHKLTGYNNLKKAQTNHS